MVVVVVEVVVVRVERFRLDSNNFTRVYLLVGGKICRKRKNQCELRGQEGSTRGASAQIIILC